MALKIPSLTDELSATCDRGHTVTLSPIADGVNVLCSRILMRGMCRLKRGDIMGPPCPHAIQGKPLGGHAVGPCDFLLNRPAMILSNPLHANYGLSMGYSIAPVAETLDPGYRLVGFDMPEWLGHLQNPNLFTLSLTSSGELVFVGGEAFPFTGYGADLMNPTKCKEWGIPHVLNVEQVEHLKGLAKRQIYQRSITASFEEGEMPRLEGD